ncbi:amino acid/polyamine/organocation transporter (APC superfamily) [Anseongella ginsenosidimutans]|uniref:Amino acid/polyamine/organocation transporter (APC superfamily) n=1 Tax=Anseongella ginsenosidimutans TaxID=496056 RepID=A0A4R3KX05_9SPHI|nr:amino acid permease [Anseongella ginsenosidimutans]QEC51001.1 amino acid permease [Anseongella ginsenosidimutans]TCS90347.1 amino acid/polyamine/organocation transporter (APC superfamily) [Anseongella ginsenosidimutans]
MGELFRRKTIASILREADRPHDDAERPALRRTLGVRDLIAFGIAAIVGAGIFSTIGKASADGGPAVIYLFLFTAVACAFTAFAYAEFASIVPVSGSAYTYSYVAFGELIAWIIGWSLIMEYAIGNTMVAISWSDYLTSLLSSGGIELPPWMTMDYLSARNGFQDAAILMESGKSFNQLDYSIKAAYHAWEGAPSIGGFHVVADLPALLIIWIITWLVYRGIRESRNASNTMVVVKLAIILLVIAVGVFYIDTDNWDPFMPNGLSGVLRGVSAVFFAYIGFDAISTTAEECKNPQRDLPRGMMWAIVLCTLLYIAIALVLTGMVHYDLLAVGDPLAFVFEQLDLKWLSGIIAASAVVAMASVLLVFQMGQPRIWMSMSRDGLLPKAFSRIHPRFKTPSFATIVTGFVVATPVLFMNMYVVADLCSIGTLFAFTLVCAGVLRIQSDPDAPKGKFKTPYINARYVLPLLAVALLAWAFTSNRENTLAFLKNSPQAYAPHTIITSLNNTELAQLKNNVAAADSLAFAASGNDLERYLTSLPSKEYEKRLAGFDIPAAKKYESGWKLFRHKIPAWVFFLVSLGALYYSVRKNLSLIPVLGMLCCLYMMSEMGVSNWLGFGIWLLVGLVIYFSYGIRKSRLRAQATQP